MKTKLLFCLCAVILVSTNYLKSQEIDVAQQAAMIELYNNHVCNCSYCKIYQERKKQGEIPVVETSEYKPKYLQGRLKLPLDTYDKVKFNETVITPGVDVSAIKEHVRKWAEQLVDGKLTTTSETELSFKASEILDPKFNPTNGQWTQKPYYTFDVNVTYKNGEYSYVLSNFIFYFINGGGNEDKYIEQPVEKMRMVLVDSYKRDIYEKTVDRINLLYNSITGN